MNIKSSRKMALYNKKYQTIEKIGKGTFGLVFKVKCIQDNKK